MDFNLTPKQIEIKKIAKEFAEREFPKVAKKCDQEETFDFELIRKACEAGLNGIFIDKDYGGAGFGYLENAFVMEEFWRVDPGLGGAKTCVFWKRDDLPFWDQKIIKRSTLCLYSRAKR